MIKLSESLHFTIAMHCPLSGNSLENAILFSILSINFSGHKSLLNAENNSLMMNINAH